ncbi:nucleotidyltransferase domain-containing protein [Actinomyces sp. MRS3W]|uniref:nucleotidyltransferase domain-containing protein n=1 Tax=Actinomyces sp. MRS3W TaxID=2800796 RepID=UPI0028FD025C|nr:nucleotidyltransferase domain-containing protein [Actinomyces sp. MRS3W]MDU0348291.1 nucleotidyltransferase domain-containing protein [Actinomyces sp. MRS3W]
MAAKPADVLDLKAIAQEADKTVREARTRLVSAVRTAHQEGMTQAEIADRIGRSQPEVSRLLRFHGTTPLARRLRASRSEVIKRVKEAGGSHIRVFGSVATGTEHEGSDIDLLFRMNRPMSLMDLARLEADLENILGVEVDIVPDSALAPYMRERVLQEAIPL